MLSETVKTFFVSIKDLLKGKISDAAGNPQFQLIFDANPFSLKKLLKELGMESAIQTSDPAVLQKLALRFNVDGSTSKMRISNGALQLDDSKLNFSLTEQLINKERVMPIFFAIAFALSTKSLSNLKLYIFFFI